MPGGVMRSQLFSRRGRNPGNPVMRVIDVGAGVTLSPHLVGMHFHRWPEGNPLSSAPTYGFGTARSHDYGLRWSQINTAAGGYNWSRMDTWVNAHAGRKLVYQAYGTPGYLRTSDTADLYGSMGGASVPSDSAAGFPALQAFITALINRYNDGTPARRKIHCIEVWNEPKFDGRETGFWWGTASHMVDMARAVTLGRNASVDIGVKVWSPGFDGLFVAGDRIDQFLSAESAQEAGTYGLDWCEEIAIHLYQYGYGTQWTKQSSAAISDLKAILAAKGIASRSWHISEEGIDYQLPVDTDTWPSMTDTQRGLWQARHLVLQGLLGAQTVCLYSHDNEFSGDFRKPALSDAINRVHTEMAGKTVTSAQFRMDGSLDMIADGQLGRI